MLPCLKHKFTFSFLNTYAFSSSFRKDSVLGAAPELWALIYTCAGMRTSPSMHACGCVCACNCVSAYFSKAHFRPCAPLCGISLSLCHLLVFLSARKQHLRTCASGNASFTLILFLSSYLRTLPILNPACNSSTRRGKPLSRLRDPCPQSPPPLSGPGGLRLRHSPQREAVPNLLEAGECSA